MKCAFFSNLFLNQSESKPQRPAQKVYFVLRTQLSFASFRPAISIFDQIAAAHARRNIGEELELDRNIAYP